MERQERREERLPDRRRLARGGRRITDRPGKSPKLLIADSYAAARIPCARYLDFFNFHVDEAVDGQDALARIAADPPDVVLIEQGLPAIDPVELSRRLLVGERERTVSVILMSSHIPGNEVAREQNSPAGILVKPFPLATMLAEVRRVIRARTVDSELAANGALFHTSERFPYHSSSTPEPY